VAHLAMLGERMMRIEKKKTNGVDALDGLMKKIEDFMKTLN
jgi:hypothetical protein